MISRVTFALLFLASAGYLFAQNPADVVVNEIFYNAPATGSPKEWFEIYNKSSNAINLLNWKWKDATGTFRTITNQNRTLNAGSFAIVCEDSAALKVFYPSITGIFLQSIGWNALNNTGDQVVIQTAAGLTIDSVSYLPGWGGGSNISLERISAAGPSNDQSNWGSCINTLGATPNLTNSISGGGSTSGSVIINELMYDFPPGECEWVELFNNSDSTVNLRSWKIQDNTAAQIVITNSDYFLPPDSFVVLSENNAVFANHPGLRHANVIINPQLPDLNNSGDAVIIYKPDGSLADRVDYLSTWGGNDVSLERISTTGISNDSANWTSSLDCEKSSPARINSITNAVHYSYHDLILNEINFSPDTGNAEWIELYNPTNQTIDISGWQMVQNSGGYSIADTCQAIIKPGMYVVFASDNRIFNRFSYLSSPDLTRRVFIRSSGSDLGLNNDGDMVKLIDLFKDMIDSVYYLDDWHNPNLPSITNISLEKINPSLPPNDKNSWSSSANPIGGTPGLQNSIYTKVLPPNGEISVSPNPFSPDNDGFEDFAVISYKLTSTFSQARAKIYDVKGRLVRTLLNNQTVGSSGSIIFDGLDEEKQKLRVGIYIIFFEALNDQNGVVETLKTTVVVAARL